MSVFSLHRDASMASPHGRLGSARLVIGVVTAILVASVAVTSTTTAAVGNPTPSTIAVEPNGDPTTTTLSPPAPTEPPTIPPDTTTTPPATTTAPPTTAPPTTAPPTTTAPPPPPAVDQLKALTGPSAGQWCAKGLDAASINAFFRSAHGRFYGADYQRAYRLSSGKVLWMLQDAAITTPHHGIRIVHNVGMLQTGRCFTLLARGVGTDNPTSWLFADRTIPFRTWYWAMGGEMSPDGTTLQLMVAQMTERGTHYLADTRPMAMRLVRIRISDMRVMATALAPDPSISLYGWSVTSDANYTYLYSNSFRQFVGVAGKLGQCTEHMKVARVPKGRLAATPRYWDGTGWNANPATAVSIIHAGITTFRSNPGQVIWTGWRYLFIEKESDWFGVHIVVMTATKPTGPWTRVAVFPAKSTCNVADTSQCNTYFASWVPWRNPDGRLIFGLGHNRWDGSISKIYRPSFHPLTAR